MIKNVFGYVFYLNEIVYMKFQDKLSENFTSEQRLIYSGVR